MSMLKAAVRRRSIPLAISGVAPAGQSPLRYPGFTPTVVGGVPPYSFSLVTGAVPNGTSFSTSTGAIGTELLQHGTYTANPTIRVTDAALTTRDLALSIPVSASTTALANQTVSAPNVGVFLGPNGAWFAGRPASLQSVFFGHFFSPGNGFLSNNGEAFDFFAFLNTGSVNPSSEPFGVWRNAASGLGFFLNGPGSFSLEMRRAVDGVSLGSVIITVT